MKRLVSFFLAALTALSASVCFASADAGAELEPEAAVLVENDGMTLAVPEEYCELLVIETPEDDEGGVLFTVSEKASIEAAEAQGMGEIGAGWLFGIGRISEARLHELLCGDMSGVEVFAVDGDGVHYAYYHPTDVRFVRGSYNDVDEDLAQWGELNEWAATVKESFVERNDGLVAESYGNTEIDIYLARIAYAEDTDYTIGTPEYGALGPDGVDPAPYLERLMNGVVYEYDFEGEAPDGECIVLSIPEDDVRFDFFPADGNCVRMVWFGDEQLYRAAFADGETEAAAVMREWYEALAEQAE